MLKNLVLNTLEKREKFEFHSAEIFTTKYSAKLKANSIHVPNSAKIILTLQSEMTVLIVEMPIIKVDLHGNVIIHTHTDYKTVTLANAKELLNKDDVRILKAQLMAVKNKKVFGSTSLEVIREQELSSKVEVAKFLKKIKKFTEGGGF